MSSPIAAVSGFRPAAARLIAGIGRCRRCSSGARAREETGTHVAGWSLVDSSQRHPILVSQQPATLSIRVASGAHGLSDGQAAQVSDFLARYRSKDSGNSKLVIAVPSGSPNESAAMRAVGNMREMIRRLRLLRKHGRDAALQRRPRLQRAHPPRLSCATWPKHLNAGIGPPIWRTIRAICRIRTSVAPSSTNLAAQIVNPADLARTAHDGAG